ncbi:MAG: ATP-binding protein, partial [Desulfobulbaceae bacterium]|nr:ATP-binding protein [Desulfobulbaceae bacterium]
PLLADVGEIRRAAGRAAGLVRQLLAFSRKQKAALEVVDLNGIIRNMEMMLDRLIGEDIEMVMELAEGLLPVRVDSGQIEQVAVNLVVNGRDAMPLGGRIIVRTEVVELGEGVLPPQTQAHAGLFACLTVTDSGRGMSKEVIDKAFEPFFTTKEVGKGSGLGLAVAYGIVEQHGGWIRIDSELGKGTSFRVYLPLHARDEVTAPVKDDAGKQPPQGHQERILLVEDQEEVLQVALSMLEGNGYQVLAAATMAEAVMLFEQQGESIDLLFSDIVLPDGNGLLLEERFRARKPGLPVLMSSGYVDDRMQLALLQERRLPFLQKPYTMEALLAAVRQVLAAANGHLS